MNTFVNYCIELSNIDWKSLKPYSLHLINQKSLFFFYKEKEVEKEGDRPELTVPYDEQAFLLGQIPILGGEAKPRAPKGIKL